MVSWQKWVRVLGWNTASSNIVPCEESLLAKNKRFFIWNTSSWFKIEVPSKPGRYRHAVFNLFIFILNLTTWVTPPSIARGGEIILEAFHCNPTVNQQRLQELTELNANNCLHSSSSLLQMQSYASLHRWNCITIQFYTQMVLIGMTAGEQLTLENLSPATDNDKHLSVVTFA